MISNMSADYKPEFTIACKVEMYECFGTAPTKRRAKQTAAKNVLDLIAQAAHGFEHQESTENIS